MLPGGPFVVRESHSAVMSCALPTWLSEDFVKTLNLTFGGRLKAQLVEMIGKVNSGKAYKDGFRRAPTNAN